jgi:hypothetical protein
MGVSTWAFPRNERVVSDQRGVSAQVLHWGPESPLARLHSCRPLTASRVPGDDHPLGARAGLPGAQLSRDRWWQHRWLGGDPRHYGSWLTSWVSEPDGGRLMPSSRGWREQRVSGPTGSILTTRWRPERSGSLPARVTYKNVIANTLGLIIFSVANGAFVRTRKLLKVFRYL